MGLKIGDHFRLGESEFVLMAALLREPDSTGNFMLGPRTIVGEPDLAKSGLIQPGTLYDTKYRLMFRAGTDFDQASTAMSATFGDQGYRWRDARKGAEGVERFVDPDGGFPDPDRTCRAGGWRRRDCDLGAGLPRAQTPGDCHVEDAWGRAAGDFPDLCAADRGDLRAFRL